MIVFRINFVRTAVVALLCLLKCKLVAILISKDCFKNLIVKKEREAAINRGGGDVSRFQVTGMIEWGQKPKPKKLPGPKIIPQSPVPNFQALKMSIKH